MKILYTAITRAKVNVFVAETNSNLSSPMFTYFKQRNVVKQDEQRSEMAVFGKMSSNEDWLARGESYMRHASGDGNIIGNIKRAVKCFEKAGEQKRMRNAQLALDVHKQQENLTSKQDLRSNPQQREKLYEMATKLLEAKDVDLLDKAGLCLLRSGDIERKRCAEMFELSANLSYARRNKKDAKPDKIEQRLYNYAGEFYQELFNEEEMGDGTISLVNAIRNYLFSGSMDNWKKASDMISHNSILLQDSTVDFGFLSETSAQQPIAYVYQHLQNKSSMRYQFLRDSLSMLV